MFELLPTTRMLLPSISSITLAQLPPFLVVTAAFFSLDEIPDC